MSFKIIPYKATIPVIDKTAYISEGCCIAGEVTIGKHSGIWFNTVLRGDVAPIRIGDNTNIQDGSVVHTSRFNGPVEIGNNVTIGHMALIHACIIHDNAFIGMRSIVMDYTIVEEYGFVAAGSLVTANKIVKTKELWAGTPAKFIRYLRDEELELMKDTNQTYIKLAKEYRQASPEMSC